MSRPTRLVIGCMTGTSLDAVDAALVRIDGRGLMMRAAFLRGVSVPLADLARSLRELSLGVPASASRIAELAAELSRAHVEALCELVGCDSGRVDLRVAAEALARRAAPGGTGRTGARRRPNDAALRRISLVAVHGQTVCHAPPLSWQLFQPASLARAIGAPVVFDLRAADLAAGGQGAPITPIADFILFAAPGESRVVLNLGGFASYTLLPRIGRAGATRSARDAPRVATAVRRRAALREVRGGDVCACNQLLDALARRLLGRPFDVGGARAAAGRVRADVRDRLEAVLAAQAASRRSLGSGDEPADWIDALCGPSAPRGTATRGAHPPARGAVRTGSTPRPAPIEDTLRSACEAVGRTLAAAVDGAERVLIAGGGTRNRALCRALAANLRAPVEPTDAFGVPADFREAVAMAILGALCADGVPITLPQVTGCSDPPPRAGAWVHPP